MEAAAGPTELRREDGQSTLKIGLNAAAPIVAARGDAGAGTGANSGSLKRPRSRFSSAFGGDDEEEEIRGRENGSGSAGGKGKGKRSVMEVLMEQERAKKAAKLEEKSAAEAAEKAASVGDSSKSGGGGGGGGGGGVRKDYWLRAGVVVKLLNKKVGGGKYYKKKGRIRKVIERYVGEIKMLDSGDRLRVDQEDLETVRTRCYTADVFRHPSNCTRIILHVLSSCPCSGFSESAHETLLATFGLAYHREKHECRQRRRVPFPLNATDSLSPPPPTLCDICILLV